MECKPFNQRREIVLENDIDKISYVMTTFPMVIDIILQHLPARDVCSCALVCKFWNNIAELVKRKRNGAYFLRMSSIEERHFCEWLRNCWSEPDLVIVFGPLGIDTEIEYDMLDNLKCDQELSAMSPGSGLLYIYMLKDIANCMNKVRQSLPKKCQLIRIPLSAFYKVSRNEDRVLYNPLTSALIIPSMPGVEMGVFSISSTTVNDKVDTIIKNLYISKQYNTWGSDFKCILLFSNFIDNYQTLRKDLLTNTPLEKYISDKTIIVGGTLEYLPISTGITFAGDNIQIVCVHLTGKRCCTKYQLFDLKNRGFDKKMGITFLLSTFTCHRNTLRLFQELFPNILPFGVVSDGYGFVYHKNASNISFEPCDECGSLLNIEECEEKICDILLFVMYKEIICKVIDV